MRSLRAAVVAALVLAPVAVPAQARTAKLDDPAIVGIFAAANTWDVSTGGLGARKATRQDVKDFGKMLSTVHASVLKQAQDLATKLGVKPTKVPDNFPLLVDYTATMKKLSGLKGAEFDKAFLEHEIAYHKAVIDAVTNVYLPAIQNAELKKFVQDLAPAFVAHMQAAQALLDKK